MDTGGWFGDRQVWASVTSDELFLVAAGKRPLLERVYLQDCYSSHYNPSSGEVVIATESLMCNQLAFHPGEAMELLKALGIEESNWTGNPEIFTQEEEPEEEGDPVAAILKGLAAKEEPTYGRPCRS